MNLLKFIDSVWEDSESIWEWLLSEEYIEPDGFNESGEVLYKVSEKGNDLLKKGYENFNETFQEWKKLRKN